MLEVSKLIDAKEYLSRHSVVLFDLDDTIYSEKEYVKSCYAEIACHYPEIKNMAKKLWDAFKRGEKAIDYVLQNEGLLSSENITNCLNIYRSHQPKIAPYPDAIKLIDQLKKDGCRLGLITDGRPDGQRAKIKALDIEHFFEKIIITDEFGSIDFRKPNTRAFEEMHDFFNTNYKDMVYVGDNPAKDFTAPEKLGMNSVCFKNSMGLYF